MNQINRSDQTMLLSDDKVFYTIEGEGKFAGLPSVFMRLSKCNLTCKGFASPDSPHGCDSYTSWSVTNKLTFDQIVDEHLGQYKEHLLNGAILKITGGEPLLQQSKLIQLLSYLKEKWGFVPVIDFETNGTLVPSVKFQEWDATYTVSPKLASNGDPEAKRYVPVALNAHADLATSGKSIFKFVVNSEDDMEEIVSKYVDEFDLPPASIWLMPCCGSRLEHLERAEFVVEMAKKYHFNFSPRLQVLIYDKTLKV